VGVGGGHPPTSLIDEVDVRNLTEVNHHRQVHLEIQLYGQIGNEREGIFAVKSVEDSNVILRAIASSDFGWDHVSVSPNKKRCPTWGEMTQIRHLFFTPDETVMQLHVASATHISNHDYCLHLWRPQHMPIPVPPLLMV
jgi:hypothetical protein